MDHEANYALFLLEYIARRRRGSIRIFIWNNFVYFLKYSFLSRLQFRSCANFLGEMCEGVAENWKLRVCGISTLIRGLSFFRQVLNISLLLKGVKPGVANMRSAFE